MHSPLRRAQDFPHRRGLTTEAHRDNSTVRPEQAALPFTDCQSLYHLVRLPIVMPPLVRAAGRWSAEHVHTAVAWFAGYSRRRSRCRVDSAPSQERRIAGLPSLRSTTRLPPARLPYRTLLAR